MKTTLSSRPKLWSKRYRSNSTPLISTSLLSAALFMPHGELLAANGISTQSQLNKSEQTSTLSDIYISEHETEQVQHSFATSHYTAEDIAESGAINLSEFLTQNTNIQVQPAYGNPFSSSLDMAGYGIESGHENIKIIVDGYGLNAIDGSAVLLNSLDLQSIQSITLMRGSGSVLTGNNSSAGVIVIKSKNPLQTKHNVGLTLQQSAYGTSSKSLNISEQGKISGVRVATQIHADHYQSDGSIVVKADGRKNLAESRNVGIKLVASHTKNSVELSIENSTADLIYVGNTDLVDFQANPASPQTNGTHQDFAQQNYRAKWQHQLNSQHKMIYSLNQSNKTSRYLDYGSRNDYLSTDHQLELRSHWQNFALQSGLSLSNAYRDSQGWSSNRTQRNDYSIYALANYELNRNLSLNAGLRKQQFDYQYQSNNADNSRSDSLQAANLGAKYQIDNQKNVYMNLNQGFLAPNIDRFFLFDGSFNGFIEPMTNQTLTVGYNQQNTSMDFELQAFYNKLKNEIYYNPATFQNTNLDKSHKYGLNLRSKLYLGRLNLGLNYSYVQSLIDAGSYADKKLPGVAENTVTLFANYDINNSWIKSLPNQSIRVEHKQTSESFAISDFNNALGRYPGYQSTDISYKLGNKNLNIILGINNLFDNANGLYIASSGNIKVYPTLYERRYFAQIQVTL